MFKTTSPIPQRRQWTTQCADPTVVVEWTVPLPHGSIRVTEFQGVYTGTHTAQLDDREDRTHALPDASAEAIHQALEAQYAEREAEERGDGYAAWRRAAEDAHERIQQLEQALGNLIIAHAKTCTGCDLCIGAQQLMEVIEPLAPHDVDPRD